jgi:hypothetical protein
LGAFQLQPANQVAEKKMQMKNAQEARALSYIKRHGSE